MTTQRTTPTVIVPGKLTAYAEFDGGRWIACLRLVENNRVLHVPGVASGTQAAAHQAAVQAAYDTLEAIKAMA